MNFIIRCEDREPFSIISLTMQNILTPDNNPLIQVDNVVERTQNYHHFSSVELNAMYF